MSGNDRYVGRSARATRDDERVVLTVPSVANPLSVPRGVYFSLPRVIGVQGVPRTVLPPLSDAETEALRRSAELLREAIEALRSLTREIPGL